jgi:Domain of unknown function (DUF5127)
MKFSAFRVSDPRLVCPRTCRWSDLFVLGGCTSEPPKRYRERHRYCDDPHTNRGHCASWAHASESHLPKSYRGLFLFFCYFRCIHTYHIKPQDWVKHSIPFSYMAFAATSMDGASHAVQVYSDVSGGMCHRSPKPVISPQLRSEWNSGDRTQTILWTTTSNANDVYHSISLQTQVKFMEVIDQAEWGTLYYAMQAVSR